jgi:hypothetical protein
VDVCVEAQYCRHNLKVGLGMPIPEIDDATGYLPGGTYDATLDEVRDRFAYNYRRREIFSGLEHVLGLLRARGVTVLWLGGSFVTAKMRPGDVDVVYVPPAGADPEEWDDLSFARHDHIKQHHRVDLWPYPSPQLKKGNPFQQVTIKEYFESDEDGFPKGMIHLVGMDSR